MKRLAPSIVFLFLSLLLLIPGCSKKVQGIFTAADFDKKVINLESQTVSAMEKAYSKLPERGTLTVKTDELRVSGVASRLEKLGLVGLTLDLSGKKIIITCYKGKEGPAYETGRTAKLKSSFIAAAVDDENQLLFKTFRISEKTAQIYLAGLYYNYVQVSEPAPDLFSQLTIKPSTFEPACRDGASEEVNRFVTPPREKPETVIIYKGPFKMLILKDGTMIRRCQPVQVSKETAKLLEPENCQAIKVNLTKKNAARFLAMNYSERFKVAGKYFLLSDFPLANFNSK